MERAKIPTDQSLSAWNEWWVEAQCTCRRRYYPCTLLGQRYGADRTIGDAVRRLICQECGERPRAELVSEPIPLGLPTAGPPSGLLRVPIPST